MSIRDRLTAEAYPETEIWRQLKDYLAQTILPILDERFPAIQILGSQPKGYAMPQSDVDFKLYFFRTSHSEALIRYRSIQEILVGGGWQACHTGSHVDDHHIVHLDELEADKIRIMPIFSLGVYVFLCRYDLVWLHKSLRQCMDIADLFAGGFVKDPSMDIYRKKIINDISQNDNYEEFWKVIDALYRGHISRISLRKHGLSRREEREVARIRRTKFRLPSLESLVR